MVEESVHSIWLNEQQWTHVRYTIPQIEWEESFKAQRLYRSFLWARTAKVVGSIFIRLRQTAKWLFIYLGVGVEETEEEKSVWWAEKWNG